MKEKRYENDSFHGGPSKFKDTNNYTIEGWMVNVLKLKGNELTVFALIHTYTQQYPWFECSQGYMADATGVSKTSVNSTLKKLVEKKFLIKVDFIAPMTNSKYCKYRVNEQYIDSLIYDIPGEETCPGGEETCYNILINNKNNNNYNNYNNVSNLTGGVSKSECLKAFLAKYEEIYGSKYTDIFPKMYSNLASINDALGEKEDYTVLSKKLIEWMMFWSTSDWQKLEGNFTLGAVTQLWIRNKLDGKIPKNPPKSNLHDESDLTGVIRPTKRRIDS